MKGYPDQPEWLRKGIESTLEDLKAAMENLVERALSEGFAAGVQAGAIAERKQCLAIARDMAAPDAVAKAIEGRLGADE